ncbi:MAG TPA: hypothetical protein VIN09_14665 [Chloroflexota bacterium]
MNDTQITTRTVRKVFRAGNSLAVPLPGAALRALSVDEGDLVDLEIVPSAAAVVVWRRGDLRRGGLTLDFVAQVGAFVEAYGEALAGLPFDGDA